MPNIYLINGSTHKNGFNAQLTQKIAEIFNEFNFATQELQWQDIPIFSQDNDYPAPASVERVRRDVFSSDALFFITPEYNGYCPGGLKNLIDWLSRSIDPKNPRGESFIHNRITAVTSAAAGGGVAVRNSFEQLLTFVRTRVVKENACGVAIKSNDWQSSTLSISDEESLALKKFVQAFVQSLESR